MKKEFLERIMQNIQSLKPSNSQLDKIGEKIKHNTSLSIEDYKIINEYRLQYTIPLLHLRNYFNSRLKKL